MVNFKLKDPTLKLVSSAKSFGGFQQVYSHESRETGCVMKFSMYIPPVVASSPAGDAAPQSVVYWLSGLTCSEENFIIKSGFQRVASRLGLIVVGPDTSPRGLDLPGERDSWDFGLAAGFYVDATQEPWTRNYRMYSYVTKELRELVESNFPIRPGARSIMGHSMGGHGALVMALRNPGLYRTVSAFAPICNPTQGPWGIKAFTGYLGGENRSAWDQYDSTVLVAKYTGPPLSILIDQGDADPWLEKELLTSHFVAAAKGNATNVELSVNFREGYDHGYYYISSFIEEHLEHHASHLNPIRK